MATLHEPLVQTVNIPTSTKARQSVEAWAVRWEVKKSAAMRAILRRGLLAVLPAPRLREYPRDYAAQCAFRVPEYMLAMIEQAQAKERDWEMSSVLRSAFYQGLIEVQKDGLMVAKPRVPEARNREQMTLPL